MSWIADLVPPPSTRAPLSQQSFVADFLPTIICYFTTAALVLLPDTFPLRFGLLPITLWSAFRAVTVIDIALAYNQPRLRYLNFGLSLAMLTISFRAIDWTFRKRPLQRQKGFKYSSITPPSPRQSIPGSISEVKQLTMDTLDLAFNLRGHGWCWGKGLRTPPETRRTDSTSAFVMTVFFSAVLHLLLCDTLHYTVQMFSPDTFGSNTGGSIIDNSLPHIQRYSRSTIISTLSALTIYSAIQTVYDVATLTGILILRQHPTQWPPIFNAPWSATSLSEFWSRRWHQVFRSCFIAIGFRPASFFGGRAGGIMGAFLISGILHDWGMWGMGRGTNFWAVSGFFLMMGVGVIMEGAYKKVTGKRVGGWVGFVWTMCWALGWANMLVDAWARTGLMGSMFLADHVRPAKNIFSFIHSAISQYHAYLVVAI